MNHHSAGVRNEAHRWAASAQPPATALATIMTHASATWASFSGPTGAEGLRCEPVERRAQPPWPDETVDTS